MSYETEDEIVVTINKMKTRIKLDPDRLANIARCLSCGTKNEPHTHKCKHCGNDAEWLNWNQFGGE